VDNDDLAFAGAAEQARMLAEGTITAPVLLEIYLDRIARLDPQLRSYRVVLAETARSEALAAQRRLDSGERLPLLGVPVAIKDDIDVGGEVTTRGTNAMATAAVRDSEVVSRLRAAGAVIIGKTAVPELMMFPFTESPTFGATRNPWNTEFSTGGSSGGSAAAVAAGLVPLAVGSDGGGSIRIPSGWCGLYGLKPQRHRVPLAPNDDAWCGLDVNGPIARSVEDAALFLDVTSTLPGPAGGFVAAAANDPGRLRIALSAKVPPLLTDKVGKEQRAALDAAGALLRGLGHDVVVRDPNYPLMAVYANYLPRYFRGIYNDFRKLTHPDRVEKRTRNMARIGSLLPARLIKAVRARESAVATRIQSIFQDIDVLITPGNALGPPRVGAYQGRSGILTLLSVSERVPFFEVWNLTGQPAAVVPWGFDSSGIPLSIQLVGRPSDEATLLSLSAQIETNKPWADRRPPVS
jgi:amidase